MFHEADVAVFLCHCVLEEKGKGSQICLRDGMGWDGESFVFFRGPQGISRCSCLELSLPVPCLITGFSCWCSRDAFCFLSSAWDSGCAGLELTSAARTWTGLEPPGKFLHVSAQQLLADSFVPFPSACPCPTRLRTPLRAPSSGSAALSGATLELLAQQSCFAFG